jgi:hypothetical protein
MTTKMGEVTGADYSWVEFFLGWWSLLFNQEWWGHIRYGYVVPRPFATGENLVVSRFFKP